MKLAALFLLLGQEVDKRDVDPSVYVVPPDFSVRVRFTEPARPLRVRWRHGSEGLGGSVTAGAFAESLPPGAWSEPVPLLAFAKKFPQRLFLTVTFEAGKAAPVRELKAWFDFQWRGRSLKIVEERGPDGGTVGLYIPAYRLGGGKTPDHPDFLRELGGISAYARERAERLEASPAGPRPSRYFVVTDLGGHGAGTGYGIRHSDPAIVETEAKTLRRLGVNALRGRPAFPLEGFSKGVIAHAGGFPVVRKGEPGAGCPSHPAVPALARSQAARVLEHLNSPHEEVWLLTVDEIGSVLDGTVEGKAKHMASCADCAREFREWLRGKGRRPSDFGKADWSELKPTDPSDAAEPLAAYESGLFGNVATARLFAPLREAVARANAAKRSDPALRQPWLYSYALRANNFLMGGASLDFFEYYRHADNAFVYETSNRDPRIWGWDSYLCDVGRVVAADQGLRFGVYVKPHRGAPVQRMLAAASRNARMLYWYTYGPDYHKGDSFSERPEALDLVKKAALLLGRTEEVLYGSSWARPAEVAVVKPTASERWLALGGPSPAKDAAWENAKWITTALQHAHIPVDPLDEALLETRDLARYKVIYVNGPQITRAAAGKLAGWVRDGGTLCTSGGGLAFDEAGRPLALMDEVLGLRGREAPRMSYKVALYGATKLETFDDPRRVIEAPAVRVDGVGPLVVGREFLMPSTAQVVARYSDGEPAATLNAHGKGQARVLGFFPGLEYGAGVRGASFDMSTGFPAERRAWIAGPALEKTSPVVDASVPTVEGVLLRNDASGRLAVTLANWAYRTGEKGVEIVPVSDLKVVLRGVEGVSTAWSAALDRTLKVEAGVLTLPRLEEGDVLLLGESPNTK